jgi:hypothetical protein
MRPWARSRVRSSTGTRCQARRVQRSSRVGWLALTDEQVVRLLDGGQELGGVGVGLQCVGGDHRAGKVEVGQQWLEGGDLARGAVDLTLGDHRAGGVVHYGQQGDRPGAGQHRGGGQAQDGDQRVAAATGSPGVGTVAR